MTSEEEASSAENASPGSWQRLILSSAYRALQRVRYAELTPTAAIALRAALVAIRRNDAPWALRHVDRAWRATPNSSEVIGSIYARVLSLLAQEHDAVLRLLARNSVADADLEVIRYLTLRRLRRDADARQTLNAALVGFCWVPSGLLAHAVDEFIHDPANGSAGWLGRDANLDFVGVFSSTAPLSALTIRLNSGAEFMQPIKTEVRERGHAFRFKPSHASANALITASVHEMPLLGSGCRALPDFALDGRSRSLRRRVQGWLRVGWLPSYLPALRLQDEQGRRIETGSLTAHADTWEFAIDLRGAKTFGARIEILARLPDATWWPLPDSPLLLEAAVDRPNQRTVLSRWTADHVEPKRSSSIPRRAGVDVVIPVFAGRDATLACIESVRSTAPSVRIIVVDDSSNDEVLVASLEKLQREKRIVLLRNPANLGFVGSANRGLAHSRARDVVLLNSDTMVFGDWLRHLRDAAYSSAEVGTVTPFSNNGSIASYPSTSDELVSLEQAAELNRVAAHRHRGVRAPIPVGIGFCLYLRRDCLNEVGEFDVGVFGRGYGEETDFCLRARTLGWSHLLAADVFVYHAGALSFGSARHALLQRSQRLLNLRHPGFDRYIRDFLRQDSLHPLRRALDEYRLQALGARIVLLVTVSLPGGIDRFVAERSAGIRERGMIPLVLRPSDGAPHCCRLLCDELDVPNLEYEVPQDLSAFSAVLRSLAIDEIEFEHFLGLDPRVIELIRSLGVPYDVVIHDYAWICPRVTLVDGKGRYCGEPAVEACETCVKTNGSELRERISVAALRQRSGIWLTGARKVSAPSLDAATRLRRYMNISIATQPHSDILTQAVAPMKPTSVGNVRVVVIGALGDHKGYRVLLECARNARARRLALEFVVVGYSQNDAPLLKTGKVFITGAYQAHELPYLLRRERPHLAFIASVWPETWCYAVDEAHAAGIPVVAFDIGGVAERLHNHNIGPLLPLGLRPGLINDTLIQLAQKSPLSPSRNMAIMPKREEKRMEPAAGLTSSSDALSASVQMLPLSAGLYLFSVRVAPSPSSASDGTLRLPAMHVGLGPGVRSDQVEFISGPTTGGSWLFAKEDCLVTKVNGAGAVLLLTSIRGPGGESLAIKVERLDGRVEAAPALAASAVEAEKPHQSNGHDKATKTKVAKHERPPNEPYILATQINAHIRSRGDMSFRDTPWAGRIGPGLWIESFSVTPLARFEARDVEYKGLTGSGFETPWLTDGTMCGTKGLSVPLVGFAVRLKSSPETAAFDCEYSGYFKSGAVVGPLRNGAPCRSTVANDPLEGLQIAIRKRASADLPMAQVSAAKPFKSEPAPARPAGPTFGRYREAGGPTAAPGSKTEPLTTTRQGAAGNQVKRRPTRRG